MYYDPYPRTCWSCGGRVEYICNRKIYGRDYGSGFAYRCTKCGAYVGTHKPYPKMAMGVLANKKMRTLKVECHKIFDSFWKGQKNAAYKRSELYVWLARQMNIPMSECHFGFFNEEELYKALGILQKVQHATPSWDNRGRVHFEGSSRSMKDVPISERRCIKCNSNKLGIRPNPKNAQQTDLVCLKCGAWQKFATKDERRYFEMKGM